MTDRVDEGLSRRRFLKGTAAGLTGIGVMAVAPGWALVGSADGPNASETDRLSSTVSGPLVAYVRDAKKGEVVIMAGTREVVRTDRHLVACLMRAVG